MASITELRTYRTALYTARSNIAKTGNAGQLVGAYQFTNWTLDQINAEISRVESRIARRLGYDLKRSKPNFNDPT